MAPTAGFIVILSVLITYVNAGITPTGIHPMEMLEDGISSKTHFADFLRALYAPRPSKDVSNDLSPLLSSNIEDEIRDERLEQEELRKPLLLRPAVIQKRNSRYCGSYLADALEMACSKSSYSSLFGKRSSISASRNEVLSWPFIASEKAHKFLGNQLFHRTTRGVHDECCIKGCTFKELTSYCTRP